MTESAVRTEHPSLEESVAARLSAYLELMAADSDPKNDLLSDLLSSLEFYIPQLLSETHSEWGWESLDGFYLTDVRQVSPDTVELRGAAIIISDQSLTPFFVRLTLASSRDSIASYLVLLGERGGTGRLGISVAFTGAHPIEIRNAPLESIQWAYRATSEGG